MYLYKMNEIVVKEMLQCTTNVTIKKMFLGSLKMFH